MASPEKVTYGDFQTPDDLALQVCHRLHQLGVRPSRIVEPTCGLGAFVRSALSVFGPDSHVLAVDINAQYVESLRQRLSEIGAGENARVQQGDFFHFDWQAELPSDSDSLLVLGNLPWVTNSQLGLIGADNLPKKSNFNGGSGVDALTGKSNFDISEWMLLEIARWFQDRQGYIAILSKTAVARKLISHLEKQRASLASASIHRIDAKRHFNASVDACMLLLEFRSGAHNYDCHDYPSLQATEAQVIGFRRGVHVRDTAAFERHQDLFGKSAIRWRSGVKHDCADVMELWVAGGEYRNALDEIVDIEDVLLFPLLKSSDIAGGKTGHTERRMIVTQRAPGEPTGGIRVLAPKTWCYLENHADWFDRRKSRIYLGNPRYSLFGVGEYTFAPWKIAISGLYKSLSFRLVGPIGGRPVVFDDTVYFLPFESHDSAEAIYSYLVSDSVQEFLASLIFWEDKRPIKASVLNTLLLPETPAQLPLASLEIG